MPVFTSNYKLLKYNKLKNSFIEIQSTLHQDLQKFHTSSLLGQKISYLVRKLSCTDSLVNTSLFDLYKIFVKFPCEYK